MGYAKIPNLYRPEAQTILMFKEVWALEKIHGTSAHITFEYDLTKADPADQITYFSGGTNPVTFANLFSKEALLRSFPKLGPAHITVFGESYGGKEQGMSYLYGPTPKFIAFDVRIGGDEGYFLSVPEAHTFATSLGLEFVFYKRVPTDLAVLDLERDAGSAQAIRNNIDITKCRSLLREGIVLRPLVEMHYRGHRICAKHKSDKFGCGGERKNTPKIDDPEKLKLYTDAQEAAEEFVTVMRLHHVIGKMAQPIGIEKIPEVIHAMIADIELEAKGEILENDETRKAISRKTVAIFKKHIQQIL